MLKRSFDIFIAIIGILIVSVPSIIVFILIRFTTAGPAIYWSPRVGRLSKSFLMPKFRSMKVETPLMATDKLENPEDYITGIGKILRKTSFDEIPQLVSVLFGHMSVVGPRPALKDQKYLVEKRCELGIDLLRPGITGWAQVHGRDEIGIDEKIKLDYVYFQKKSFIFDMKIIMITVFTVMKTKNISH